ncbi:hypothetical protein JT26_06655 [Porphyromonas sp. COT-108 OH1349]|uniref:Uncharacterized protein n=1 Tax=Porphyromonas canoris TaxID=36875 RepID=A0ABR4XN79_9PORP|nr:hypothetical protein JT26_06655 [Porphyromonas sp. COT-108 OH1349]KGN93660.1 hypothetical protein HQ43_00560 [Porphyromonas canoris]
MSAIFGADKAQLLFCTKTRLFLSLFNCFDEGKKNSIFRELLYKNGAVNFLLSGTSFVSLFLKIKSISRCNRFLIRVLLKIANLEKIFSQSISWGFFALIGVNFNTLFCKRFLIKKFSFLGAF